MIYTTYFDKLKELPDNIIPVSICLKPPNWYNGVQYKKLAPKQAFFDEWKKSRDNNYYISCFKDQVLSRLCAEDVVEELTVIASSITESNNKSLALVCYEQPFEFCHRHLVSKWLNEKGFECKELK